MTHTQTLWKWNPGGLKGAALGFIKKCFILLLDLYLFISSFGCLWLVHEPGCRLERILLWVSDWTGFCLCSAGSPMRLGSVVGSWLEPGYKCVLLGSWLDRILSMLVTGPGYAVGSWLDWVLLGSVLDQVLSILCLVAAVFYTMFSSGVRRWFDPPLD